MFFTSKIFLSKSLKELEEISNSWSCNTFTNWNMNRFRSQSRDFKYEGNAFTLHCVNMSTFFIFNYCVSLVSQRLTSKEWKSKVRTFTHLLRKQLMWLIYVKARLISFRGSTWSFTSKSFSTLFHSESFTPTQIQINFYCHPTKRQA